MPRPKKSILSYLHHKPTNQAYVCLPDGNGGRKPVYLGLYNSPESRAEYARIVQEFSVSPVFRSVDQVATRTLEPKKSLRMSQVPCDKPIGFQHLANDCVQAVELSM
jgi:hypothetical protein